MVEPFPEHDGGLTFCVCRPSGPPIIRGFMHAVDGEDDDLDNWRPIVDDAPLTWFKPPSASLPSDGA